MTQQTSTLDATYRRRLLHPYWTGNMSDWQWHDCGLCVGPAILSSSSIGKANLAWLALDLEKPPISVNVRGNPSYVWVVMHAQDHGLEQLAAMYTLPEFEQKLEILKRRRQVAEVRQMLNDLQSLVRKRLYA